ncbi:F-box protein CPR1-like [Pyrus x bretschneideri]|uniref:F-box protein CPR1-like n=1 Tax=Pyrus x bretschneideri TaxID=225117 RepID=UPI00202F753B|nr:F-box protein CPR1-like [Pyrus x bretschneideri]
MGLYALLTTKTFRTKAGFQDEDAPTIIWYPSVRKYVILPSPNIKNNFEGAQTYIFGYDSQTNDYEVLRIVTVRNSLLGVEVYSLAKRRWTCLSAAATSVFPAYLCASFLINFFIDAMHWILPRDRDPQHLMVSFDFSTELFHEIEMPEDFGTTDWGAIVVDFKTEKEMAATALDGYPSMNPFVESLILLSQSNVVSY